MLLKNYVPSRKLNGEQVAPIFTKMCGEGAK